MTPDLATVVAEHREEIAARWEDMVYDQLPEGPWSKRPRAEGFAANLVIVQDIIDFLTTGTHHRRPRPSHGYYTASGLLGMGYSIRDLVESAVLINEAALPFILQACCPEAESTHLALAKWARCMQTLLSSWIADFTDEANRRLAAQQRRTQAILEMVQVVSSSLALDVVLQRVTRGLAAAVNAHRCWVFLLDQDQANITIWSDAAPAAGVGVRVQPLVGQSVPLASSALACAAVQQKAPVATGDALSDPCAQGLGCQLGLRSALAVPLVFRERVLAVAVAATLESDHSFAPEEIELAAGIANAVAPAIENARLYEQVAQMATNEERARLARDLHDQLSQALGYLELKASSTRLSLSEGGVEQAEAGLVEIEQAVEQLYEQVHEAIFRLRAAVGFGSEFLPALRKHLLEYGMYYGVEAQVVVEEEESLAGFAPRVGMQVFYIILEALANVRKHSHARRAWVRFEAEGAGVCVTVEDDGRGFDPQQAPQANSRHFGLQTMRERAQSVGGRVTVVSQVGRGTRVVIWVPQETGDQS